MLQESNIKTGHGQQIYMINSTDGKGQGWVAICKIRKGTRILAETPLFTIPRFALPQNVEGIIVKELKKLEKEQQRGFFALHNAHGTKYSAFLGITKTNTLPLGTDAPTGGIFLEASRLNHACNSNAQNTWNENLNQITIHSIKDIEEGEEIAISYLGESEDYQTRQQSLKASFAFDCTCALCSLPTTLRRESDRKLNEITRLDGVIGSGATIISTPLACLNNAHKLLSLLQEENITDARLARLWYDAFQIAIANGDEARAKIFAERAHAERIVVEGEDSLDTMQVKEFAKRPASHRLYGTSMKWKQAMKRIPQGLSEQEFEDWLWKKTSAQV